MELTSAADLRTVYRQPRSGPVEKVINHLDEHCVDFLARAPFFVLSTASADGVCDGSPKGGEPGFVQALDGNSLAWADFSGNNRLDSFENLVGNDSVALLFMIPGLDETLRVNGRARLVVDDPELGARFAVGTGERARPARVVVVVSVDEAYIHCAKALRRAGLWDSTTWPAEDERPNAACIVRDHVGLDIEVATLEQALTADMERSLWAPGGEPTAT
ncbi:MAG: MSMEG_1061 family FMN-dependent PPOX-type flavoprotein [Actinomycetota bacterium]